jgi:hypothetical protein
LTEVKITKIKTSLSKQMAQPGGRTVADIERRANERLDRHKVEVMSTVGQRITDLEALVAARTADSAAQVYALGKGLLDTAGFFDTGPLYEAGYSLCETADLMIASNRWQWPSIEVHVHAMRLIFANGCKADPTSEALMVGLRAIVAKARAEAEAAVG